MESRFDSLAKALAGAMTGVPRREALRRLGGTVAGAALAVFGIGCDDDPVGPDGDPGHPLTARGGCKKADRKCRDNSECCSGLCDQVTGTCACPTPCGTGCCGPSQDCINGICVCSSSTVQCGTACCTPGKVCSNGACVCPGGAPFCGAGTTCCGPTQTCTNGECICPTGTKCGSECCGPTQTCGGPFPLVQTCQCNFLQTRCGMDCCEQGEVCINGACGCPGGAPECGTVGCCGADQTCVNGACTCPTGTLCGRDCCTTGETCVSGPFGPACVVS